MKRIFNTVASILLCAAMLCPTDTEARGRKEYNRSSNATQQTAPARTYNPGNHGNSRPGGNHGANRHDGNHHSYRPGGGHDNHHHGVNGYRPGGPQRPAYRPGGHYHSHVPPRPMPYHYHRPHLPAPRPWGPPPPPPPTYRPWRAWPSFATILGISLGSAINISVNTLISSGYVVSSYSNNMVYLSNVPMLNMSWPDATLYYGAGGGLVGSDFVYSTQGYNMARYDLAYSMLVSSYGSPYSVQNSTAGIEATWWGPGGQFIKLSYLSGYNAGGYPRYFTTLSFGRN